MRDIDKQVERCGFVSDGDWRNLYATAALKRALGHKAIFLFDFAIDPVSFCKVNNQNRLGLFDLDWVRKENCSAYQAWILSGRAKEDCVLDMNLEFCKRTKRMVICFI